MTFMKASVVRSSRRTPVEAAIAVCRSPSVQTPNASMPCSAATANAARSAPAARPGSSSAVSASKPSCGRGGRGIGEPRVRAGSGGRGGAGRGPRACRASRAARRRRGGSSRRSPAWPSCRQRISTLVSSTAVACVGDERAKRDISERSRTTVTWTSPAPARRAPARARRSRAGPRRRHATPTSTSRKRAGAAPCETRMSWPGSPLPQLPTPRSSHAGAEQTASRPPQKRGVTPA